MGVIKVKEIVETELKVEPCIKCGWEVIAFAHAMDARAPNRCSGICQNTACKHEENWTVNTWQPTTRQLVEEWNKRNSIDKLLVYHADRINELEAEIRESKKQIRHLNKLHIQRKAGKI